MGGAQSAQRESEDSAGAEESGKVDDAQTEQHTEDKLVRNNGQISEINRKADGTIAEVNGHCEDEIAAVAILLPDKNVSEAEEEMPLKKKLFQEKLEMNENESSIKADADAQVTLEMTEMNAKQNDINESFKRFFSSINLKLTVKRGSAEKADITVDAPEDTTKEEPNRPEDGAKENKSENAKHGAHETYDQDSTCPTLTGVRSEDILENAEQKVTENKEDDFSDKAGPITTLPVGEDEKVQQNAKPEEEVIVSPIKRFFLFGLRRKKKPAEDETTEKELADVRKTEAVETTQQTVEVQQDDVEISLGVEALTSETEHKVKELKEEILSAASAQTTDEGKAPSSDPSTIIVNEPEILSSQEKDKVQASPLKRLLSGSSLKKSSKKQRERKSSDAKLSDFGEHVSNQFLSSTNAADDQKEECPAGEEDGAWASLKKLVTPKKSMKKSSLTNEEKQIPGAVQESKLSEGEQISDHSTEESKKRKDSSVSWEAVLCGSGRRRSRSRKTSDSEDERSQAEDDNKQESPLESSNEVDRTSSPKQAGSPPDGDGGSTWKSFKKLVTPKRKAKDDDIQSDVGATQDDSSFSIKKLLPGQKKRKPVEKQDYVSSDEADKEVVSDDEDSATPAVVPLSEFDTVETGVYLQTHADIESHVPKEADYEIQQDVLHEMSEPVLPCDSLQTEAKKVQENKDPFENFETFTIPASKEEPEDVTEIISKHQQLSDIPEEGIITETVVTPASVTEEPARDDTIAEDMIEITSEAITAPEPVDNTLADETEMVSAVSQLSESSNTSGNATPVPAEYELKDTEELLHQVVENISISPKELPLCSEEIHSERIVASVSRKILESFIKQDPTILEIHRRSDATAICMGLKVKELDSINELAAIAQTESLSEVSEAISTELVSEVSTEEFDTAELSVDDIHRINVTHLEERIEEFESTNEGQDVVECQSEINEAMSTEILPKSEETVADECSLVEVHQTELENSQIDNQEEDTRDEGLKQKAQSVLETKDKIVQNINDQPQAKHQDQSPVELMLQALATAEAATLKSKEDISQSPEHIPAAATVTYEPKEEPAHLTEVTVEPEKVDELQADAAKIKNEQVSEKLGHVVEAAVDSETTSIETPAKDVPLSEDIPPSGRVMDEPKEEPEPVTEITVESDRDDKLQTDATKTEHEQVEQVFAVQVATLESEMGSIQTPEMQVLLSDVVPPAEAVTEEPEEKTKPFTEVNVKCEKENELQRDPGKNELFQVPEVLGCVQATAVDSEMGGIKTTEMQVPLSEDIVRAETVTFEPEEGHEPVTEVPYEPENENELQTDVAKIEYEQVSEVLGSVQQAAVDAEMTSSERPKKDVQLLKDVPILEDIPSSERVIDEPKEETEPVTEVTVEPEMEEELQKDAVKTEHVQVPDVLGGVQVDSEMGSTETPENKISLSEDTVPAERFTDKSKEEPEPVTKVTFEPEKDDELQTDAAKIEHEQVQQMFAVQVAALESDMGSIKTSEKEILLSQDPVLAESGTHGLKEEPEPVTKVTFEPEKDDELQTDAAKIEHEQVQQIFAVQVAALESDMGSIQTPEMQVLLSDVVPPAEAVTGEPEEKTKPLTAVDVKCEKEDELQADAAKTEYRQVPEVLAVQTAALDSDIGSIKTSEKEILLSQDPALAEAGTHEFQDETEPVTEVKAELEKKDEQQRDSAKTEQVQVSEVLGNIQATAEDLEMVGIETPEMQLPLSGDIVRAETVTHELQDETEPVTEGTVEPEKDNELQADAAKMEYEQVSEVLGSVQQAAVDAEMTSSERPKKDVQLLKDVPILEDIPSSEKVTDEPKEETEPVTEVTVEPEMEEELQKDAVKTEHVQVPEVLGGVQVAAVDSEMGSTETPENKISLSEDTVPAERLTDKPKEEPEPVTEVTVEPEKDDELKTDVAKIEYEQVQQAFAVQVAALESDMGSIQTPEIQVLLSDVVPPAEAVTEEPEEKTKPLTAVDVKCEKEDELQADAAKTEYRQVLEVLAVQAAAPGSDIGSFKTSEMEILLSEDTALAEAGTHGLKDKTEPVTEVKTELEKKDEIQADAAKIEYEQVSEVLGSVQQAAVDAEMTSSERPKKDVQLLKDVPILEDIPSSERVTDEPKEETEPVTEVTVEPEMEEELQKDAVKTEHVQVPNVLGGVQAAAVDLEMGSTETPENKISLSEDTVPAERFTDKSKEEPEPVTKVTFEPEKDDELQTDAAKIEHEQVQQIFAVQVAALESDMGSIQTPEMQVLLSDVVPPAEAVTGEPEEKTKPLTAVDVKCEKEDELQADAAKTEYRQVLEVLAVQTAALDSDTGSIKTSEKEILLSQDPALAEAGTHEFQDETEPVTEVKAELEKKDEKQRDSAKTEQVKVSEVLGDIQATAVDSEMVGIETPEMQLPLSGDIVGAETVTHELQDETEPVTEVTVEPEIEEELQKDAAKTEHVQLPDVLGGVRAAAVDSEMGSTKMPENRILISEETVPAERLKDEPKEETEPVTKVTVEPEKKDKLKTDAAKIEHEQVQQIFAVQVAGLESEVGSIQTPEIQVLLSDVVPPAEAVTEEPEEKTKPLTAVDVKCEKEDELQADAAKTEYRQVPEVLAVQTAALDSDIGSIKTSEKEILLSQDPALAEAGTHEFQDETEPVTEVKAELEKKDEQQRDSAKTEHVKVSEVLGDIQATAVDSEMVGIETPEMQLPLSGDIVRAETVTCEVKEETQTVNEVNVKLENKDELQTDADKTEYGQVPGVLAVQAAALDLEMENENEGSLSEDIVSVEPEKEPLLETALMDQHQVSIVSEVVQVPTLDLDEVGVISQTAPETETIMDEAKKETEPPTEINVESMNAYKTEDVQEPEVLEPAPAETSDSEEGSVVSLEMELISGETQPTESVTDEPSHATQGSTEPKEEIRVEAQTGHVQESEVLSCNAKDTVTETESEEEASTSGLVGESVDGVSAQQKDAHSPDADYVIVSVTDEIDSKAVREFDQVSELNEDQTAKSIPRDVRVEQEARIPDVADMLQTLLAVHVSSVNEETNSVPVLEKNVISEETPAARVDNATVAYEAIHEVHLSEVQGSVAGEKEGELAGAEMKIPAVEHAVVVQVITCNLRELSAAIPDVLIEKRSDIREPLIDTMANELEFKEEVETTTPKVESDVTETAKEDCVVVMMQVPSAEFEDNHRFQVQVVEVDIKSAEMIVDSTLEVGETEAKEVIDVCHVTGKVPDKLSATEETEEELINMENPVIIHKVIQHVKENLPQRVVVQTRIQDEVVNLEQEPIKQPDDVAEMREMAESESDEVDKKEEEEITRAVSQRRDEALISDDFKDPMQTLNVPGSLPIHDHTEDLEEHKAGITAEEFKPPSEELQMKKIYEEISLVTSKTAIEGPQSTGKISSIGNLESHSSPSVEFKQFGQAEVSASKPPATERPLTDESELGGQAVGPQQPINATPRAESQKKTAPTEVPVQETEMTKLELANVSTERAVIMNQPVLLDVSIRALETVQLEGQVKSTQGITPNVQERETMQPVRQTETARNILTEPHLHEACSEKLQVEKTAEQIEEENDQDLWLDAEEDIYTQEESDISNVKVEEPVKHQTESDQEEKSGLEHKFEMAPETASKSEIKEEESQQEMQKTRETGETETESEEFAVAPEHIGTTSADSD